jgi:HK97 family phage portal protein
MGFLDLFKGGAQERRSGSQEAGQSLLDMVKATFGDLNSASFAVGTTGGAALKLAAVFNAIHQQAQDVAVLSLDHKVKDENGFVSTLNSDLQGLLHDSPFPYTTSYTWRYMMVAHCLSSPGNGYTIIHRDGAGNPFRLEPVKNPNMVKVHIGEDEFGHAKLFYGMPKYKRLFHADDVLHFKFFTLDGVMGVSPITYAAETIATQLSAEKMHRTFWEKGGFLKGILQIAGKLSPDRRDDISKQWNAKSKGWHIPVLDMGAEFKPITINQRDAQYIETRMQGVEDVARIMNIPISKLKIRDQKFSNQEQQDLEYVKSTITPILRNMEQEMKMKLLPNKPMQQIKFDLHVLLRGDLKTRSQYYKDLFYMGALNPNEIRKQEGENPREGGNQYFTPVNAYSNEQLELLLKKLQNEVNQPNNE